MTKILLSGCCGQMGTAITTIVSGREDCVISAGIDANPNGFTPYQVFKKPEDVTVDCDVIIDFSHPSLLSPLVKYATEHKLPLVMATTGLSETQLSQLSEASEVIPIFRTGNLSLGINLLIALARKATAILGEDFDIEIVEKHHNQKIDAPSGTALMIADAISEERNILSRYEFDRHSVRRRREKNEIGIHSVRGGTIVGEHEVIFAGHDEVITISHSAQSKGVFATGAVTAAVFLCQQKPGMYDMNDLVAAVE